MEAREFVIHVRRRWTLWILPVLAILYFLMVVALVVTNQKLMKGVTNEMLAYGGVGLFAVVFLVEIPFFLKRKAKLDATLEPADREWQDEAPEPMSAAPRAALDDEHVLTGETQQGMRVLEYSRPAKTQNKGAVYAKTYVPVTKEFVLRIETLAAERADL
jgi:hypothetical protein